MMKAREFVSPITINVRIKMSMLYVIAIVPKALTCRDGAPPNHQVQLRCNTYVILCRKVFVKEACTVIHK